MTANEASTSTTQILETPIMIDEVRNFLPHRFPFLLIDRITRIHLPAPVTTLNDSAGKLGIKVEGIKAISYAEPCFQGHFPHVSLYPGVLMIEVMAQAACFSTYPFLKDLDDSERQQFSCVLVGVDNARFRRPVVPGDLLKVETEVTKHRGRMWGFQASISVDGQKVAEAELLANIVVNGGRA